MRKLSARTCLAMCILVAWIATGTCLADEPESIYVANTKVITIRDKGTFRSTRERAIAIEKAICEVISKQDTQHPKLSIKQVGGLWTVFCGDVQIASVYPAEAEANGMPAKSLAAAWMKNLQTNLPRATPASKLPASAFQPTEGTPASPPKPKPAPAETATRTATGPVAPVAATGPLPVAETGATVAAIGAPLLLVRDAFETARALPEEEFAAKRDELAEHLIADLTPFITGRVPSTAAATSGTPRAAVGEPPPIPAAKPVAAAPAKPPAKPVAAAPATTPVAAKPGDSSYEKVPQKNRIREKLEKAREPFLALKNEDRQAAKPIDALLAACRNAFALGNFDQSEEYVDKALELLGVQ